MNKTYAFSDIHGQYELWEQIKNFIDPSDRLIFLGDACDRGKDGIKILQEMLKDPRITIIYGNHEDFIVNVGSDLMEDNYSMVQAWSNNGGYDTCLDFLRLHPFEQRNLIVKLLKLPLVVEHVNTRGQTILLSHAGFTPGKEYNTEIHAEEYYWNRKHFFDAWPEGYDNTFIVHGHTPVQHLNARNVVNQRYDELGLPEIAIYAKGHKIDLDLGSYVTNKIVLFDLDELKVAKTFYNIKEWEEQE